MTRVAMVTANFHPYVGGAEGQARLVASELRRRGVPVFVVTRRTGAPGEEPAVDGVPVLRLAAGGPGALGAGVFLASCLAELLRRRREWTAVHAHLASSPAVAAALAARLLGRRAVVKLGGGKGFGELAAARRSALGRLKFRALAALGPTLAAPGAEVFDDLPGSGLESLPRVVVPNGVDLRAFYPARPEEKARLKAELGWAPGPAWVCALRLASDKGQSAALAAFLEAWAAPAAAAGARLYVAGTGPEAGALEAAAPESAVFLGKRADMARLYRAADAFVLPSGSEGMSNALLEAMACGLPALASDVPGNSELVHAGETGLLYAPGDRPALEARIGRLLAEADTRASMGRLARRAAEAFSIERTVDRWLEVYGGGD